MVEVRVFGKGGKEGICLLPYPLLQRISAYIRNNTNKFHNGRDSNLFEYSGRYFQMHLRKAGIDSGLTRKDANGIYISNTIVHPHRLRHSFAGNLLKKGVDIRYIKDALRHSSISSTEIYTQLSKEDLKEKLKSVQ
jgi:site-specific recombinase XerD